MIWLFISYLITILFVFNFLLFSYQTSDSYLSVTYKYIIFIFDC